MADNYTIISGTNRLNSNTRRVAAAYQQILQENGIQTNLVELTGNGYYERTPEYLKLENEVLIPSTKFIFVAPEYNGSIPGVLKTLVDISSYQKVWWGKKALLTGVSTGRAGNLRGLEHLTGILNYLKVVVHPNKLPISLVHQLMNETAEIADPLTLLAINQQVEEFISF